MKHATVLYTCVGLMGAAALTGLIDYSYASKAGLLNNLYEEESQPRITTLASRKTIEIEDYSRKAFETFDPPAEQELALNDEPKKKKKAKKFDSPPPPPPPPAPEAPPVDEKAVDIAPPPPPKEELPPVPVMEATPVTEAVKAIPTTPEQPVKIEEVKEVRWESFSRAPLKKKKTAPVAKRKQ